MIDDVTRWVTDIVQSLGYVGVAFLVALESIVPPIPSELVLPLAGFVAGQGEASLIGMVGAATLGSVLGALVLYRISASIGPDRLRAIVVTHGRWLGVKEADLDRAESWFDRRSEIAVLVCRCVPLVRSLVSIPAGFRRMPLGRFVVFTTVGSAIWNATLIGAGALLGERWDQVGDVIGTLQTVVIFVVVGALAWFGWKRFVSPRWGETRAGRRTEPSED